MFAPPFLGLRWDQNDRDSFVRAEPAKRESTSIQGICSRLGKLTFHHTWTPGRFLSTSLIPSPSFIFQTILRACSSPRCQQWSTTTTTTTSSIVDARCRYRHSTCVILAQRLRLQHPRSRSPFPVPSLQSSSVACDRIPILQICQPGHFLSLTMSFRLPPRSRRQLRLLQLQSPF